MILINDYYRAEKDPSKKTRYDIIASSGSYPLFEIMLLNKKSPNKGGLCFYCVDRPQHWKGTLERRTDKAFTKGADNISSLLIPDPSIGLGYGDINHTKDAILVIITEAWNRVEIFIIRGQRNNRLNLYQLAADGELTEEMQRMRDQAYDCHILKQ